LRKELGLSQVQFAQLSGVHPITVSKWECGETDPTPYQQGMFKEFKVGAKDMAVRSMLKTILITAGVIVAVALLLRHLTKGK